MSVKCKVCSELYLLTKTPTCPKCGSTPAGVLPAKPGSAFSTQIKLAEAPPRPEPAGVIDGAKEASDA